MRESEAKSLRCRNLSDWFEEYLNGTISQPTKQAFESHLEECPHCRKQFELYQKYFQNREIESDFKLPSDLNAKIKYTVFQAKQAKKTPVWRRKQTLAFVTAVSFLFVAGIWGGGQFDLWKKETVLPQNEQMMLSGENFQSDTAVPQEPNPKIEQSVPVAETPAVLDTTPQPKKKVIPTAQPTVTPQPSELSAEVLQESGTLASETDGAQAVSEENLSDSGSASGGGGGSPGHQQTQSPAMLFNARNIPLTADLAPETVDITLDQKYKEVLLGKYPFVFLEDEIYRIDITHEELLAELGEETGIEDTNQTAFVIRFADAISEE